MKGEIHIKSSHVSMTGSYIGRDSYKEFTCIYGGIDIEGRIHIRSSHVSMRRFIFREGFI